MLTDRCTFSHSTLATLEGFISLNTKQLQQKNSFNMTIFGAQLEYPFESYALAQSGLCFEPGKTVLEILTFFAPSLLS